ncbi:aminotransferase class V-fold PLP-dependent enzyme [Sphaerisporangium sp. NPDC051011]|uniref:aminotransferase class V-fold PLP-dependent enzyme n=1 Tax=Sphaerisporangium sp. NPDC051011 TaxID=3155792 RepID=UPI0033D5B53A
MRLTRRQTLAGLGAAAVSPLVDGTGALAATQAGSPSLPPPPPHSGAAGNERYWAKVAREYEVADDVVNLENGFFGPMPRGVAKTYEQMIKRVNGRNSYYLRTTFNSDFDAVVARVAKAAGVSPDEIALTRGATEALQTLISGYNRLKPGDTVVYSDLDYDSMQYTMNWLRDRRGVNVVTFAMPEPASRKAVLDAYARVLDANPKTRLLLLTHLSHRTGLVIPVPEIADLARARGIDVIVDAAHSWGHLDFSVPDLRCDFAGFNLHKWMGAPLGVGFLYIKKDRLADIDPAYADPGTGVRARIHTGTTNSANVLAVPAALDFHDSIGTANKQARLRFLRDRWVSQVRGLDRLQILTPDEPGMYGAITSFRLRGRTSAADNNAIQAWLLKRHDIFTVRRGGVAAGDCIRVTPALYNSPADCDRLAEALHDLVRTF